MPPAPPSSCPPRLPLETLEGAAMGFGSQSFISVPRSLLGARPQERLPETPDKRRGQIHSAPHCQSDWPEKLWGGLFALALGVGWVGSLDSPGRPCPRESFAGPCGVCWGGPSSFLAHLYPLDPGLDPQLLHQLPCLGDVVSGRHGLPWALRQPLKCCEGERRGRGCGASFFPGVTHSPPAAAASQGAQVSKSSSGISC